MTWFEASKEGLAKLVEDRPKIFIIHELLSNAWDTGCMRVNITLKRLPGVPMVELTVLDDHPEGFANLDHAWTLFADSERKVDAETIGRFNMGEKLVLSLCSHAIISTTTGTVVFNREGRTKSRSKREWGSYFLAKIRMTKAEYEETCEAVQRILARPEIDTTFNGKPLKSRDMVCQFEATLPTVIGDHDGVLRKSRRKTVVEVYEPRDGEQAMIYELGIPVVESGDKYHVNVRQKVPLNMDRDNVPPAFKRLIRGHVLNHTVKHLTKSDASSAWVTEAMGSKEVEPEAVRTAITKRFGEKSAVYDPSDPEANHRLTSKGYTVISGGSLPKEVWQNVKAAEALRPSGHISPTSKPYSDNPLAPPVKVVDPEDWTDAMREVVGLTEWIAKQVLGFGIEVRIVNTKNRFAGAYGNRTLDFNIGRLGRKWFAEAELKKIIDLIIHELGHEYEGNHLSENYYKALTRIAGQVVDLALEHPERFLRR